MRVFMTGATGFVGTEVVRELIDAGHKVLGLARSDKAADTLAAMGAGVHAGTLEDLDALRSGAGTSDAVIHLGFNPDFSQMKQGCETDQRAIEAIGSVLAGSDKPLIVPNGIAGLETAGRAVTEADDVPEGYRFPRASEQTALQLALQGVLASVIRLPQVHNIKKQGLVTRLIQVAQNKGVSAFVGEGLNRWPAAQVTDVARLFRLVLEAPRAGARYHAVAEEGVSLRVIADHIGRIVRVPTKPLTAEQAREHFGPLAMFVGEDMPASAEQTKERLNWHPTMPSLLDDLEQVVPI